PRDRWPEAVRRGSPFPPRAAGRRRGLVWAWEEGLEGGGRRLGVDGGEREITLGWIYAARFLLLLPTDGCWRLLDAVDDMPRCFFFERRHDFHASDVLRRVMAARMKNAARGRTRRRRNVTLQDDALLARFGIRDRNRRQQRLGVRHQRLAVEIVGGRQLH